MKYKVISELELVKQVMSGQSLTRTQISAILCDVITATYFTK